jgi:hypothetical protein
LRCHGGFSIPRRVWLYEAAFARNRADYGGHSVLKEVEGGCRGKSLLNLFQVYLPCVPNLPLIFATPGTSKLRLKRERNRGHKLSKNFTLFA